MLCYNENRHTSAHVRAFFAKSWSSPGASGRFCPPPYRAIRKGSLMPTTHIVIAVLIAIIAIIAALVVALKQKAGSTDNIDSNTSSSGKKTKKIKINWFKIDLSKVDPEVVEDTIQIAQRFKSLLWDKRSWHIRVFICISGTILMVEMFTPKMVFYGLIIFLVIRWIIKRRN